MSESPRRPEIFSPWPFPCTPRGSDFDSACYERSSFAPVAQLDRASVYGTEGRMFESCRVRHSDPVETGLVSISKLKRQFRSVVAAFVGGRLGTGRAGIAPWIDGSPKIPPVADGSRRETMENNGDDFTAFVKSRGSGSNCVCSPCRPWARTKNSGREVVLLQDLSRPILKRHCFGLRAWSCIDDGAKPSVLHNEFIRIHGARVVQPVRRIVLINAPTVSRSQEDLTRSVRRNTPNRWKPRRLAAGNPSVGKPKPLLPYVPEESTSVLLNLGHGIREPPLGFCV
jgi:hypothetical protein